MTTLNFTSHFVHDAYNFVLYPWFIISNLPQMFVLPVMIDLVNSFVLTTRCEKPGWRWTTSNFGLRQLTERERLLGERRRRPFYTISHTYHTHTFKYNFQPWLPYSYLQIQLSATPTILIPSNTTFCHAYYTHTFRLNYQPYLPYLYLPIQLSAIPTIFIPSNSTISHTYHIHSIQTKL